jgi:hypothetical protein
MGQGLQSLAGLFQFVQQLAQRPKH